jgi:pimeloyl-ACP methyl ester carboxylesterase
MSRFALALLVGSTFLAACGSDDSDDSDPPPTVVKTSYTTETADGWTIAVHNYRKSSGTLYREPVVMSGGYLENSELWDAFPKFSLAHELAWNGFDVWTYDIRGTGQSESPAVSDLFGWTFSADEFIKQDTPAAVNFILAQTGATQVTWVAHSLGGTMLYGYLQRYNPSIVRCAVTLGGIGRLKDKDALMSGFTDAFFQIGTFLSFLIPPNMPLPLRWALDTLLQDNPFAWAGICYALDSFLGRMFWNPDSINPNMIYQFLRKALSNTSTNVLKQFLQWADDEQCIGDDGWNYTAALPSITTPLCVMAGGGDQMVPPVCCQTVYENVSSTDKQYIECSVATGHTVDFGHLDMLLGTTARIEVYGHVVEFLGTRSTPK